MTDTAPAAQPVWPTTDLLDEISTSSGPANVSRYVMNSARSPAGVPVACATTQDGTPTLASRSRARMIASFCPAALGA